MSAPKAEHQRRPSASRPSLALEIARRIGDVRGVAHAKVGNKEKATKCFQASKLIFGRLGLQHMVKTIERILSSGVL